MKEDEFNHLIRDNLQNDLGDIKMSSELKNRIKQHTVRRPKGLYNKIAGIMDYTIEISIPTAVAACCAVFVITLFAIGALRDTGDKRSLLGYTDVKVIDLGGTGVIIQDDSKE